MITMPDDLRDRVLAAVRKGLAASLDMSKTEKPWLRGYNVDSVTESAVTNPATGNRTFPNEIKGVTALPPVSAIASQEKSQLSRVWPTKQSRQSRMAPAAGSRSLSCRRRSAIG